jgi:hypothetical protein
MHVRKWLVVLCALVGLHTSAAQTCTVCPAKTIPSGEVTCVTPDAATVAALVLEPGFWRASTLTADLKQCPRVESCNGGAASTCADGYEGPLCGVCSGNSYISGNYRYDRACRAQLRRNPFMFVAIGRD